MLFYVIARFYYFSFLFRCRSSSTHERRCAGKKVKYPVLTMNTSVRPQPGEFPLDFST